MSFVGDQDGASASEVLAGLLEIAALSHYIPGLAILEAAPLEPDRIRLLFTHESRPGRRYLYERSTAGGCSDPGVDLQELIESSGGLPKSGDSDPIHI
jgi:hypothetical protein